jgi:hypothetical protein
MSLLKRLSQVLVGAGPFLAFVCPAPAGGAVIGFEALGEFEASYVEAGFRVSFLGGLSHGIACSMTGSQCGNDSVWSSSVGEQDSPTMSIAAVDGRPFTFAGFDGVSNPWRVPPVPESSITVTGLRPDSTVFTQVFDPGSSGDFLRFESKSSFDSFVEVHFTHSLVESDWGIDNVRVTPVPEPGSLLLIATGIAAVAWRRRRAAASR